MFEQLLAALMAIAAGLRDLNTNLAAQANGKPATAPVTGTKAPKPPPVATGAGAVTQADPPVTAATASISYQDLAQKFTDLLSANKDKALEIFGQFGCKKKLTELKVEQYDAFSAAIDGATPAAADEGGLV